MSALSGCSIAVTGKFPGYTQAKLKVLITGNGAKFEAGGVTSTCTHLITPPQASEKWHTAWANEVLVVGLEWLMDSLKEGKKLDENPYLHKYITGSEPKDDDNKKHNRDEPEGPKENSLKRPRGRNSGKGTEQPSDQDTIIDETTKGEETKEISRRGIGRPKTIKAEILEPAKTGLKERGRAAKQAIEAESEVESTEAKNIEPVVELARKRGRPTKKPTQTEPEAENIKAKGAEPVEPTKRRGRPAKKIIADAEKIEIKDAVLPKKRGRQAEQTAKDEEPVKKKDESAKEPPKKRGKISKEITKAEVEREGTIVKDAELTGNQKIKKATKSESKTGIEETLIKEEEPGKKQTMLGMKSEDTIKVVKKKNIPVDAGCPLISSHHVYIDPSGTPFDASLGQTNIGKNNNKFYIIQLLESKNGASYAIWTHWGRIGEFGQSALVENLTLEGARKIFEAKFKDKSGLKWENRNHEPKAKKYAVIERNYMDESGDEEEGINSKKKEENPESKPNPKISPELQSLMQLIFNPGHIASSMAAMRYDAKKLPLGKLSKKTLSQGFAALKDLSEVVTSPALAQSKYKKPLDEVLNDLTSRYYTVIPHDFGRQRPPIIRTEQILKMEVELVETLGDMEIANEIMKDAEYPVDADGNVVHPLDKQFQSLGLEEAILVDRSTTEFIELEAYLRKSQNVSRAVKLMDVFRITRPGEAQRFEEGGYSADKIKVHKVNDARKLLWHGSRSTNFGGILSQGLRIAPPEAPVNGYAFGKGVYLADLASKSCQYLYPHTSDNQGLLLLCEAQLGDPVYERYDHDSNAANNSKKKGSLSTWAQGKTQPKGWKDAGAISEQLKGVMMPDVDVGLMNPINMPSSAWIPDNEYIVYSVAQVKLRYLFRVSFS